MEKSLSGDTLSKCEMLCKIRSKVELTHNKKYTIKTDRLSFPKKKKKNSILWQQSVTLNPETSTHTH